MKNLILILFIINHILMGNSKTILPNNLPLFSTKSIKNEILTIKKDTIILEKVVDINGSESVDQSNVNNPANPINFFLIGQTFQAGVNGKMTAIKLKFSFTNPVTIVFKVYKGTSASGTLLSTNTFSPFAGINEYRLSNLTPLQKDVVYFMEFSPGYYLHTTQNNYLRGETDKPSLAGLDIYFETVVQKDFGVRINGTTGKVLSTGGFEGDGSLLTNLNVQTIIQEAIQVPVLLNNWVNHEGTFTNAGYWKDKEGLVHLQGLIKNGNTALSTVLFTLPVGYRPPSRQIYTVFSNNIASRIDVLPNGDVITGSTVSNLWLNLSGIYFRVN